jgi:ABC-type phosphate transport system substrate-binding protein
VIHVAVNVNSPVHVLTIDELRSVFCGKITSLTGLNNAETTGRIELYGPLIASTESSIFQKKVMRGIFFASEFIDRSATPRRQKLTAAEVVGAIAKQANAIGFFLHDPGEKLDKRVRILRIAKDKNSPAELPTVSSVADGSYILTDTITFYLPPDAPPQAREFCKFATGPEAAKIVKECGLWPECELEQVRGKQRLA